MKITKNTKTTFDLLELSEDSIRLIFEGLQSNIFKNSDDENSAKKLADQIAEAVWLPEVPVINSATTTFDTNTTAIPYLPYPGTDGSGLKLSNNDNFKITPVKINSFTYYDQIKHELKKYNFENKFSTNPFLPSGCRIDKRDIDFIFGKQKQLIIIVNTPKGNQKTIVLNKFCAAALEDFLYNDGESSMGVKAKKEIFRQCIVLRLEQYWDTNGHLSDNKTMIMKYSIDCLELQKDDIEETFNCYETLCLKEFLKHHIRGV